MKVLSFSFLALTTALVMSSAFANNPSDLEDLASRWNCVEKNELSENLMGMEQSSILLESEDIFQRVRNELDELGDKTKKLESFQFATVKEDARDTILKRLFPTGERDVSFCEAFPVPKPKTGKEPSSEEQAEKLARAKFNACKTKVKEILGGTMHSNPTVHIGDVTYTDGSSITLFYVRSLVDGSRFVRYYFKR